MCFCSCFGTFFLILDNNKSHHPNPPIKKRGDQMPFILGKKTEAHCPVLPVILLTQSILWKGPFFRWKTVMFFFLHFPSCQLHHCQLHSRGVKLQLLTSSINLINNLHLFFLHRPQYHPRDRRWTTWERHLAARSELSTPNSRGLLRPSASFCVGPAKSPSGFPLNKALESTLISEGGFSVRGGSVDEALALLCLIIRVSLGEKNGDDLSFDQWIAKAND